MVKMVVPALGLGTSQHLSPLLFLARKTLGPEKRRAQSRGTEGPRHFLLASLRLCLWKSKALVPVAVTLWTQRLSAGV